jgi:hypothetical protein
MGVDHRIDDHSAACESSPYITGLTIEAPLTFGGVLHFSNGNNRGGIMRVNLGPVGRGLWWANRVLAVVVFFLLVSVVFGFQIALWAVVGGLLAFVIVYQVFRAAQ